MRRSAYTRVLTAGVLAVVLVAGGSAGAGAVEPDGSQPESGLPVQADVGSHADGAQDGVPIEESPEASVNPASPDLSAQPGGALDPESVEPPTTEQQVSPMNFPRPPLPVTSRKVINKITLSTRYTDKSRQISRCTVYTAGATCAISKGKSASRTIQTALGASRAFVAGELSISVDSTVSLSAQCDSPPLKAGQSWVAWAQGTRYSYNVQTRELVGGKPVPGSSPKTSGVLFAFNPNPAYISCGLG
ncbi:hypothetical protein [Oerskovia turbata]